MTVAERKNRDEKPVENRAEQAAKVYAEHWEFYAEQLRRYQQKHPDQEVSFWENFGNW